MSKPQTPKQKIMEKYEFLGFIDLENQESPKKDIILAKKKDKLPSDDYYVIKQIKYVPKYKDENGNIKEENHYFNQEVNFLQIAQQHNHPVVPLVEYFPPTKENKGFIITKLMKGGNLMNQINIQNKLAQGVSTVGYTFEEYMSSTLLNTIEDPEGFSLPFEPSPKKPIQITPIHLDITKKMIIIYGVSSELSFLHQKKIFHRDIKPENILLNEKGEPFLCDFGFSRLVEAKDKMSGIIGTTPYMAPELFMKEGSIQSDIYAFGVTMLMILAGKLTFKFNNKTTSNAYIKNPKHVSKLVTFITSKGKYDIPDDIPPVLHDLIDRCLSFEEKDRPLAGEIRQILESDEVTNLCSPDYQTYISKMRHAFQ